PRQLYTLSLHDALPIFTRERLSEADVVFEFTNPAAAAQNLSALARAGATVVCGTTGWDGELPRVVEEFRSGGGALVHAANFSVGDRKSTRLNSSHVSIS